MALKVHVQKIWPSPDNDTLVGPSMKAVYDAQERMIRDILGPETELHLRYNEQSTYFTNCASMEAYNIVGMLNGLAEGEAAGCDVAIINCGNDPALAAARDLLTIPVVGITEAAMLTACQLGRRFGLITMDDASVAMVERNLAAYRLEDRAIRYRPVRSAGFYEATAPWYEDLDYLRGTVISRFEEVARGLIDDGAEVIVTACGNFAALTINGYSQISGTGVPVVEAVAAGAHMARMLGEMRQRHGLTTSKKGAYAGVPADVSARMTAPFRAANIKAAQGWVAAAE